MKMHQLRLSPRATARKPSILENPVSPPSALCGSTSIPYMIEARGDIPVRTVRVPAPVIALIDHARVIVRQVFALKRDIGYVIDFDRALGHVLSG